MGGRIMGREERGWLVDVVFKVESQSSDAYY